MRLGDATRKYVANKQATGMVFEAAAYNLRAFTEKLGANADQENKVRLRA